MISCMNILVDSCYNVKRMRDRETFKHEGLIIHIRSQVIYFWNMF